MNQETAIAFIKSGVTPYVIEQELRCSSSYKDRKHNQRMKKFCQHFKISKSDLIALASRWGIPL